MLDSPEAEVPPACLDRVEAVYAELDAELAGLGYACRACGECCDLAAHGFRLYLSTLELALILEREGLDRLPPERDGRCGFQAGGKCTIHPVRPLGCRTYFCDADGDELSPLHEAALRKLRRLAERYGCPWNYRQKYPPER
ncbi:MAG: YkgJ family cysteine cluster protein [Planctomycetota bacterium]